MGCGVADDNAAEGREGRPTTSRTGGKIKRALAYGGAGALIGIGTVAVLPAAAIGLGAAGVVTLAGGCVGGGLGMAGGALFGCTRDIDEKCAQAENRGRQTGRQEATAEFVYERDTLRARLHDVLQTQRQQHEQDEMMLCMYDVGLAVLDAGGGATPGNVAIVKEWVFGALHATLPAAVAARARASEARPPSLTSAHARAQRHAAAALPLLDTLVHISEELADPSRRYGIGSAWGQLRAA